MQPAKPVVPLQHQQAAVLSNLVALQRLEATTLAAIHKWEATGMRDPKLA